MELTNLQAFIQVARDGTFSLAARHLNLTQPAVSLRIAALETELGSLVFERGARPMRLTSIGKRFLPYAERALAVLDDGLAAVRQEREGSLGTLAIATFEMIALGFLLEPLEEFRRDYPAVDVMMRLRPPIQILEMVHDGIVTLGIMGAPLWDKQMVVHAHFQEPIRLVASTAHPLAHYQATHQRIPLEELLQHTIYRITLHPAATALVESLAEQARGGSGGAVIFVNAVVGLELLLRGQGVAFLPQTFVHRHVVAGTLQYLEVSEVPHLTNDILVFSHIARELDDVHLRFIRLMKSHWRGMLVA